MISFKNLLSTYLGNPTKLLYIKKLEQVQQNIDWQIIYKKKQHLWDSFSMNNPLRIT